MTSSSAPEPAGVLSAPTAADQAPHEPAGAPVGHAGTRVVVSERACWSLSGWIAVLGLAVLIGVTGKLSVDFFRFAMDDEVPPLLLLGIAGLLVVGVLLASTLVVVQPGTTRVVQFFGRYLGTIRRTGLSMTVPLSTRTMVSVRVNNFETARLKVNDADGNPVDVAAIVVWQVADTAKAHYAVENYRAFNQVQAEAALRHVAGGHPYDDTSGSGTSLRGSTDERRAAMVSNLLVVLCGESRATPVVNTGSLYN